MATLIGREYRCAPGGIRTPNDGFEGRSDIRFTTGAGTVIVALAGLRGTVRSKREA